MPQGMNPKIKPRAYPFNPFGFRNKIDNLLEKKDDIFSRNFDLNRNLNLLRKSSFPPLKKLIKAIIARVRNSIDIILKIKRSLIFEVKAEQKIAIRQ